MPDPRQQLTAQELTYAATALRAEARRAEKQAADPQYESVRTIFEHSARAYDALAGKLSRRDRSWRFKSDAAKKKRANSTMQPSVSSIQKASLEYTTMVTGTAAIWERAEAVAASGTAAFVSLTDATPEFTVKALLQFGDTVTEGRVVASVTFAWKRVLDLIQADPTAIYEIDGFKWEEIIAGAYEESRLFDEVILTPRSGDRGRDVIAIKHGQFSIRIVDQMKARQPGHVVTADEVRSMLGVVLTQRDVSKGLITTTSAFAPRLLDDQDIKAHVPYRLELRERAELLSWLAELSKGGNGTSS
jgi:restriction system protein